MDELAKLLRREARIFLAQWYVRKMRPEEELDAEVRMSKDFIIHALAGTFNHDWFYTNGLDRPADEPGVQK